MQFGKILTILLIVVSVFVVTMKADAVPLSAEAPPELVQQVDRLISASQILQRHLVTLNAVVDNGLEGLLDLLREILQRLFGLDPCDLDCLQELAPDPSLCEAVCIQKIITLIEQAQQKVILLITKLNESLDSLHKFEVSLGELEAQLATLNEIIGRNGSKVPNATSLVSSLKKCDDIIIVTGRKAREILALLSEDGDGNDVLDFLAIALQGLQSGGNLEDIVLALRNVEALIDQALDSQLEGKKVTVCRTALKQIRRKIIRLKRTQLTCLASSPMDGCTPRAHRLSQSEPIQLFTLSGQWVGIYARETFLTESLRRVPNGVYFVVRTYADGQKEIVKIAVTK